ncbi:MAG: hypothetical protein OJF60_000592 [Burkholderiaceae bacterium]|nr:MAG: hypothetical protein OJF60_000592 [Burkholderiaceae bacterium]
MKHAQQQHEHDLVAGESGQRGQQEAREALAHAGAGVAEAEEPVAAEADEERDREADRIRQLGPQMFVREREHRHVRQRGRAADHDEPEARAGQRGHGLA